MWQLLLWSLGTYTLWEASRCVGSLPSPRRPYWEEAQVHHVERETDRQTERQTERCLQLFMLPQRRLGTGGKKPLRPSAQLIS